MTIILTLKKLGSIECLLLLQKEGVADQWEPADRLAVCPVIVRPQSHGLEEL